MVLPPALTGTLRVAVAAAVLVTVVVHVGAAPFRDALDHTTVTAVLVALGVTGLVTVCSAARWVLVARALGLPLRPGPAVAAYYRSQLLNVTLPGGVVGDVQRAWRHGAATAARGPAARAVVWERAIGVVGLAVVCLPLLVVLGDGGLVAAASWPGLLALSLGLAVVAAGLLLRSRRPSVASRLGVVATDLRSLRSSHDLPAALALSLVGVAGHLVVLVTALRATGVPVEVRTALPLLAAVLLASTLPTNVAGWGPREGAAAVVFGAAGLGAATGVTVAAVYGVLTTVAALPGAAVLLAQSTGRREGVTA